MRSFLSFHSFIHQGLSPLSFTLVTKVSPFGHSGFSFKVLPLVTKDQGSTPPFTLFWSEAWRRTNEELTDRTHTHTYCLFYKYRYTVHTHIEIFRTIRTSKYFIEGLGHLKSLFDDNAQNHGKLSLFFCLLVISSATSRIHAGAAVTRDMKDQPRNRPR